MPICQNCGEKFPLTANIDGKIRNFQRRKFCLNCSPFGKHNTKPLLEETESNVPKCRICGIEGHEHFYKRRKNSYYSWCKECFNKDSLKRQHDKKSYAINKKGGKCQICGYDKCESALEFHHKDPNEKDHSIRWGTASQQKIDEELEKCVMLCCLCHREVHAGIKSIEHILEE